MDKEEVLLYYRFKTIEEYRDFLDNAPNKSWLQYRSLGGSKIHEYIPIFITEANADLISRYWSVVREDYKEISNGIMCVVTIVLCPDYPGADEIIITGSAGTQYKKKADNHVEFDVPNAREKAIGKAFATMGNLFGRGLNRSYKVENKDNVLVKKIIKRDFSFRNKVKDGAK